MSGSTGAIGNKLTDKTSALKGSNRNHGQTDAKQASRSQKVGSKSKKNNSKVSNGPNKSSTDKQNQVMTQCNTLDEFSKRAQEIKADIKLSLEKPASLGGTDQPPEVIKLKNDILELSKLEMLPTNTSEDSIALELECDQSNSVNTDPIVEDKTDDTSKISESNLKQESALHSKAIESRAITLNDSYPESFEGKAERLIKSPPNRTHNVTGPAAIPRTGIYLPGNTELNESMGAGFKLDRVSLFLNLKSFYKSVLCIPDSNVDLLDTVCWTIVELCEQRDESSAKCENLEGQNRKLLIIKQKLEDLCRELQKSNNTMRIESLDLIKSEQSKAREQTTKIQSTLSGVIKLFDENQQRNMSLRQENQDLQTKLKSLLEHCDNWEKSVEIALRQRDIENRLIKTELAKANLLKNEEKEKFLNEKQELLRILSMMQEQQHRIEGQEAKLRSDLSSYASKYDECQAVISKGMDKFQNESKKMLKQLERSKQDYRVLLTKYETNSKRLTQLLEEKQSWEKSMGVANKKIEALSKLCRALKDRKAEQRNEAKNINQKSKTKATVIKEVTKQIDADTHQNIVDLTKGLAIDDASSMQNEVSPETSLDIEQER